MCNYYLIFGGCCDDPEPSCSECTDAIPDTVSISVPSGTFVSGFSYDMTFLEGTHILAEESRYEEDGICYICYGLILESCEDPLGPYNYKYVLIFAHDVPTTPNQLNWYLAVFRYGGVGDPDPDPCSTLTPLADWTATRIISTEGCTGYSQASTVRTGSGPLDCFGGTTGNANHVTLTVA